MNKITFIQIILMLGILSSCTKDENTATVPDTTTSSPNILFIIADDLGKDALNGFAEGSIKPLTPHIDAIRTSGISFTNLWVNPTCSPTRSSIITGKYGYRTGVKTAGDVLNASETILQKYINEQTTNSYATAIVGKWHLSGVNATINPETFGLDYYSGLIRGAVSDYYQWPLSEDGVSTLQTGYVTEVFTDLAIDWVNDQTDPWFLWLAYNAPHTPFHVPPSNMHQQGNLPDYTLGMDATPYYMAAIEAMDFQIGKLLENIPADERANTVIIFIGDNGTPGQVAQSPYTNSTVKNTLFQGGINTPMFIAGNGVTRSGVDASLISNTDLFATIAQIAGSSTAQINDSKSFKSLLTAAASNPIRDYQYSEMNDGTNDLWTISNGSYKLMVHESGTQQMYDLGNDPYETNDLIGSALSSTAQSMKLALENELRAIRN